MCGIFGFIARRGAEYETARIWTSFKTLARLSESRGKDSSGCAFRNGGDKRINVIRAALPITMLMRQPAFASAIQSYQKGTGFVGGERQESTFAALGHARLVTNGTQLNDENNQPVIKNGIVGVHNGIIVNVDSLWREMPLGTRQYEIDSEVMFSLCQCFIESGDSTATAISKTLKRVVGTVATAFFVAEREELVLATNNGSLYVLSNFRDILLFASERYILERMMKECKLAQMVPGLEVIQVEAQTGYIISLRGMEASRFAVGDKCGKDGCAPVAAADYSVNLQSLSGNANDKSLIVDSDKIAVHPNAAKEAALLEHNADEISNLKRCTKCVLPETFPFIRYDRDGVCNYCNNYKLKNQARPIDDLRHLVEPYRGKRGNPDCIVPLSGGRDSTFTLHVVKEVLGLNPIAFTYDWGMVTDLARRNIARVCGQLGVENIILAADIVKKRRNIKKNILAWLKRPRLGMIPLFMSGDKYFFHYTNELKKQTGIKLNIWGINNLENTDFKTGFAGVRPLLNKKRIYSLSLGGQATVFAYIAKNVALNPSYVNSSNLDSLGSFFSRYMFPQKDYYSLFDYYRWDEEEVEDVILNRYDWEKATDTDSTWRIGDGTASFYNYIYYNVAGFSENDTFRSNQIREGLVSREKALNMLREENRPRYASIKWYLTIVDVDYASTIGAINSIPKLYREEGGHTGT
jgi:glutamine---fructose-6-phosphate transaminase (isomerizing)